MTLKKIDVVISKGQLYLKDQPLLYTALFHHKTHENKPIRFENHKYLLDIYKDKNPNIVIISCTQSGKSEWLICKANRSAIDNRNVLYVMPTEVLRSRFVSARFDKTVEYTPYYHEKIKELNSATLKSFGTGIINFIGSNSEQGFTEFKAYDIIIDELDRCNQDNIIMATRRQSSIPEELRTMTQTGNPTFLNYGLDVLYKETDSKKWFSICPNCEEYINLDFFKHVVRQVDNNDYELLDTDFDFMQTRDVFLLCDKCGKFFEKPSNGKWVKEKQSLKSGYLISKMFATPVKIRELVENFQKGLTDDTAMQRFYNDDLGLAYTSTGAKITDSMLDDCISNYNLMTECKEPCIFGADVGTVINIVIARLYENKMQIIALYEIKDEKEIYKLFQRYNIVCGCIDGEPEKRMVRELKANIKKLWSSDYIQGLKDSIDIQNKIIKVDRTTILDGVKEDILLNNIMLPQNAKSIENFYEQMTSSIRVYDEDKQLYKWVETSADHYFHAFANMKMARKLLTSLK